MKYYVKLTLEIPTDTDPRVVSYYEEMDSLDECIKYMRFLLSECGYELKCKFRRIERIKMPDGVIATLSIEELDVLPKSGLLGKLLWDHE